MTTRRNILLLIADDLGRELGCLGNRAIRTPRIDALAAEGVSFDRAFCTTASCSSSRSTIYTGLHNHENGMYGLNHDYHHFQTFARVRTAPRIFNDAGWRTGIVNKIHVGPDAVYPWQVRRAEGGRDVKRCADLAEAFMGEPDPRPFFLTIGYTDPHRDNTRSGFGNQREYPGVEKRVYRPEEVEVPPFLPDAHETRFELAAYYESVDRLDQGVGMVLDALARTGHRDDTLVLFLSDNGMPFAHAKATLFDPGIHLPFLMRVPGGRRGVINPNLVSYVDILPTLMDWGGIADEEGTPRRGRSLLPIAHEQRDLPDWGEVLASHNLHTITQYYPTRVLRERRWKYHKNIAWRLRFPQTGDSFGSRAWEAVMRAGSLGPKPLADYLERPLEELYDLAQDPLEARNLAADPAFAAELGRMRAKVEAWQRATRDPWLFRDGHSLLGIEALTKDGLKLSEHHDLVLPAPAAPRS